MKTITSSRPVKAKRKIYGKYNPNKVLIVDYYINNRINAVPLIATKFDVSVEYVHNVLGEYFVDKCITVSSSINLIK
jgi:hypothetical protein